MFLVPVCLHIIIDFSFCCLSHVRVDSFERLQEIRREFIVQLEVTTREGLRASVLGARQTEGSLKGKKTGVGCQLCGISWAWFSSTRRASWEGRIGFWLPLSLVCLVEDIGNFFFSFLLFSSSSFPPSPSRGNGIGPNKYRLFLPEEGFVERRKKRRRLGWIDSSADQY